MIAQTMGRFALAVEQWIAADSRLIRGIRKSIDNGKMLIAVYYALTTVKIVIEKLCQLRVRNR